MFTCSDSKLGSFVFECVVGPADSLGGSPGRVTLIMVHDGVVRRPIRLPDLRHRKVSTATQDG